VRAAERAVHVHAEDDVPIGGGHLREADVAQNARVVDENVDAPERVDGGLDDLVAVFDRVVVRDRGATGGLDLFDHLVGRRR
jgi:hypothetical protein